MRNLSAIPKGEGYGNCNCANMLFGASAQLVQGCSRHRGASNKLSRGAMGCVLPLRDTVPRRPARRDAEEHESAILRKLLRRKRAAGAVQARNLRGYGADTGTLPTTYRATPWDVCVGCATPSQQHLRKLRARPFFDLHAFSDKLPSGAARYRTCARACKNSRHERDDERRIFRALPKSRTHRPQAPAPKFTFITPKASNPKSKIEGLSIPKNGKR